MCEHVFVELFQSVPIFSPAYENSRAKISASSISINFHRQHLHTWVRIDALPHHAIMMRNFFWSSPVASLFIVSATNGAISVRINVRSIGGSDIC